MAIATDCFRVGIQKRRPWLLQLTVLSRKPRNHHREKLLKQKALENNTLNSKTTNSMTNMNLTPLSVLVDEVWGKKGTPKRDAMEKHLTEEINAHSVGDAIRKARLAQSLTQEQLGERIGVRRSQISKLEKGKSVITLPTMSRVFQALGIGQATLDLGVAGKIPLW